MNKCLLSSKYDSWETPNYLYSYLDNIYNFTLDPACDNSNCKCINGFTKEDNGLIKSWKNFIVFCNPPYGHNISKWIIKAYEECKYNYVLSVLLIPARVDTKYFHEYIFGIADIYFIKGRIKFKNALYPAPFPSMICVFNPHNFISHKYYIGTLNLEDIIL